MQLLSCTFFWYNSSMQIKIDQTEKGRRIDKFLQEGFKEYSRAFLQKLIKSGQIKINGKAVKQSHVLKEGDVLSVEFPEKEEISLEPDESVKFDVLHEDENVVVVNKPAGLTVHPSENQKSGTLVNGLLAKYPEIKNVGEDPLRPGIVHRLDKDTSGIMIVARNSETFTFLKSQFKERKTVKKYIALVAGDVKKESGTISLPIARKRSLPTKQAAVRSEKHIRGKIREAVTHYRVLRHLTIDGKPFALVEAFPKTGRLHQIRVHFSAIGHPVAGDEKYGSKKIVSIDGLNRQFLHAESLTINIPEKGEKTFEAPLPEELAKLLK